jgi:hypothetical protein
LLDLATACIFFLWQQVSRLLFCCIRVSADRWLGARCDAVSHRWKSKTTTVKNSDRAAASKQHQQARIVLLSFVIGVVQRATLFHESINALQLLLQHYNTYSRVIRERHSLPTIHHQSFFLIIFYYYFIIRIKIVTTTTTTTTIKRVYSSSSLYPIISREKI